MPRSLAASGFDSALLRALRERGVEDISARTLEDWRACGGIDPPPIPRLRGYQADFVPPAKCVDRVIEFRELVREQGAFRELASLRLLVRRGEADSPARARVLAGAKPKLLDRARRDEGLVPYPRELREAMSARSRNELSADAFQALDDGPVLVGYRNEDPAKPGADLKPAGHCLVCGREVFLWRDSAIAEALARGTQLMCGQCAH